MLDLSGMTQTQTEQLKLVGRSVAGKTSISNDLPMMFLSGPQGVTLPLAVESNLPFEQQIDLLVDSPARKKILNQLVDSLCVVLLIESGGQADSKAMTAAKSAIAQVNNQMWTLEKPTDKGPALETVSVEDVKNEKWLLSSLGSRRRRAARRRNHLRTRDAVWVKS